MTEIFGWIMTTCFVICGIPQAYKCYNDGHANGISLAFIGIWILGELAGIIYASLLKPFQWPLLINYLFSTVVTVVILNYILYPNNAKRRHKNTKVYLKAPKKGF